MSSLWELGHSTLHKPLQPIPLLHTAPSPLTLPYQPLSIYCGIPGDRGVDKWYPMGHNDLIMYESMISGEISMSAPKLSRVQARGQATIPVEIRERLGLKKGDLVVFIETEQGVLINPQEVVAMEALDRIGEALKKRGISLEELIESGREIRGQFLEEEYGIKADEE